MKNELTNYHKFYDGISKLVANKKPVQASTWTFFVFGL